MKILLLTPVLLVFFHMVNTYGKLRKVRVQISHAWDVLKPWMNHKFALMLKILALVSESMPEEQLQVDQVVSLVKKGMTSTYIKEKLDMEYEADAMFKNMMVRFNNRGGHLTRGFLHYYEQFKEAGKSLNNAANSYNRIAQFYNQEAREFPASLVLRISKKNEFPTRAQRYAHG